ncbi:type IV pilin protein [Psychrobacter ciconiae]|uniref:type IV pilin protein n=1 Tax=Psychrobacter ciconiae TaxID=1553449 RepID=UPI002A0A39A3|nr:prepilin-type N-terminal cleavage/methylation domain-containing protein [Psychrobacter ciconiae]
MSVIKKKYSILLAKQGGYTLIEMMIVIVIVGLIAAVAIPSYQQYVIKTREAACLFEVKAYSNEVFYILTEQENINFPMKPILRSCASITDASSWTTGDMNKVIAIAKPPSNARIECDIPNGTPCKIIP